MAIELFNASLDHEKTGANANNRFRKNHWPPENARGNS